MNLMSVLGLVMGGLTAASVALANGTTLPASRGSQSALAPFGHPADGQVIFDQGPSTGTNSGCWSNVTESQNFSDPGPLPPGTSVTGIVIYTCIPPTDGSVTFKAVDETSHAFIYSESGAPASWVDDGSGGYIVTYMLATPFIVPSGSNVGYGLSGDGFEMGQSSVQTPADGMMSQYAAQEFSFLTPVGDQMYQLLGGSSCDVNGDGKYSVKDIKAFLKECRAEHGSHCLRQTAKFAKRCGKPD